MLLVRGFFVAVSGRESHAFDAKRHHFIEESAHALRIGIIEQRRVGRHSKAALYSFFDCVDGDRVYTFAAHRPIVERFLAVEVNIDREKFAGLEAVEFFPEYQGVGAEVDVFAAANQSFHYFRYLRMQQRFATGDADHRSAISQLDLCRNLRDLQPWLLRCWRIRRVARERQRFTRHQQQRDLRRDR